MAVKNVVQVNKNNVVIIKNDVYVNDLAFISVTAVFIVGVVEQI